MHKIEAGKFQTGNTFPKQYWLAVNGKPISETSIVFPKMKRLESRTLTKFEPKLICRFGQTIDV